MEHCYAPGALRFGGSPNATPLGRP